MSYWHFLIIAAGFIVFVTLIYTIAQWRKAPTAFKAIIWVAAANLVAGALIGVWSASVLDGWTGTGPSRPVKVSGGESTAPSVASAPTAVAPGSAPTISGGAPLSPSERAAPILNAYVGQALAQRWPKVKGGSPFETWPEVYQGCRLGNYQPASAPCKAAWLAVHGWDDTKAVSREDVASFCDAGYLEKELHLCRTAYRSGDRPVSSIMPRTSSAGRAAGTGVPESDVTQELVKSSSVWGPSGQAESWKEVLPNCASGLYAPASPVCEAAYLREQRRGVPGRIEYGEVASFCDLKLIYRESEVCRAAYHFANASGGETP